MEAVRSLRSLNTGVEGTTSMDVGRINLWLRLTANSTIVDAEIYKFRFDLSIYSLKYFQYMFSLHVHYLWSVLTNCTTLFT